MTKEQRLARKIKAIMAVENGRCACGQCGNVNPIVLEFDHKLSTGWTASLGLSKNGVRKGPNNVNDILSGKVDPSLFQVLCANCHAVKSYAERSN